MLHRIYPPAWAPAIGAAIILGLSFGVAHARNETIALSGDPAPGTPSGVVFSAFGTPVLNNQGQIAYRAFFKGPNISIDNNESIWRDDTLIALEDTTAPGTNGKFDFFDDPLLNASGQVAYRSTLQIGGIVTGANNIGIWRDNTLIVREGDSVPGTTGIFLIINPQIVFSGTGEVAHLSVFSGFPEGDEGIWRNTTPIAREGSPAPGTAGGVVFSGLAATALSDTGQAAYHAGLFGTNITATNDEGIWRDNELIVRKGNPAPETPSAVFGDLGLPVINNAGQIAHNSYLSGTGITAANNEGIWLSSPLVPTIRVARKGDHAPGTPIGVMFGSLGSPVLNGVGQVVHKSSLIGDGINALNNRGIWRDSTLMVRKGDHAPGTPIGVTFGSLGSPVLNGVGQVAHKSLLTGPGITSSNDTGIWITDGTEQLLVAMEGNTLAGKTIDLLSIVDNLHFGSSGGQDGRRTFLNDAGQLAYQARFTDDTFGIFLFTPDLHWRAPTSEAWDNNNNWTLGITPAPLYDVFVDPGNDITVLGPAASTTVKSLTVGGGGGAGASTLILDAPGQTLTTLEATTLDNLSRVDLIGGTLQPNGGLNVTGFDADLTIAGGTLFLPSVAAELNVASGGTATLNDGDINGGLMIVDPGGTLNLNGGTLGPRSFNITGGAFHQSAGTVGGLLTGNFKNGAQATIAGGTADFAASLNLSGPGTQLRLTGGTINTTNVNLSSLAQLIIDGGSLNTSTINKTGGSVVQLISGHVFMDTEVMLDSVFGTLNLADDSSLSVEETVNLSSTGTVNITGGRFFSETVNNSGTWIIQRGMVQVDDEFANNGAVQFTNRFLAQIETSQLVNNGSVAGSGRINGGLFNNPTGDITLTTGDHLRVTAGGLNNQGLINLTGGTLRVDATLTNTALILGHGTLQNNNTNNNGGTISLSGLTNVLGDVQNQPDSQIIISGGGPATFFDDVTNNGIIRINEDSSAVFFGAYTGAGMITGLGTTTFEGDLKPGTSPGIANFSGDVILGPSANVFIELAGLDPSPTNLQHDQINITSNVRLDGMLDLTLLNGFTPAYSDTFDILTYATRSGVFQQVTGHFISPVLALGQFYDDANGVLQLLATAPGDANGDLIVDISDFGVLAGNINQPGTWETGDFNGDGITNINDFGLLAANFNGDFNDLAAAAATELGITIPEPGTAGTLLGLMLLAFVSHRQHTT